MANKYIVIAGEEGGPKSNKMGGIWEVMDAEATTLASLIASREIEDDTRILVAGPYYGYSGSDWNTGQNRVTDISEFGPLRLDKELNKAIDAVQEIGIDIKTCAKQVNGVEIGYVLFDTDRFLRIYTEYKGKKMRLSTAVKKEAYELVGLDSISYERTWYGREYTHCLALSYYISEFIKMLSLSAKVSLHCHEFSVFYTGARLDRLEIPVKTVATFHATKVGRMWGGDVLEKITKKDNTWHPHTPKGLAELEALAKYFDRITFVGDTTRKEARLFYNIDGMIVRNGIEVSTDKIDWEKRDNYRNKIQMFLSKNIYKYCGGEKINPEDIIPVYTISRIELENKGYPDLLDSLVVYDRIMQHHIRNGKIDENARIVCFLITSHGPKDRRILPKGFPVHLPDEILVGEELRLKKMVHDHELQIENLTAGRRVVSAMPYPQWVGKNDGGLGMTVDEIAAGCVAAIFPSRYDPFLLTGLEAGKEGTPVVVSRICGFSDAVLKYRIEGGFAGGVTVVDNVKLPYLETITDYAMGLESITKAYLRDKSKHKMMCGEAFHLAEDMDWEEPVKKYYEILSR
jgi:glycosyltransferase involved in cell wall biosynthesis